MFKSEIEVGQYVWYPASEFGWDAVDADGNQPFLVEGAEPTFEYKPGATGSPDPAIRRPYYQALDEGDEWALAQVGKTTELSKINFNPVTASEISTEWLALMSA